MKVKDLWQLLDGFQMEELAEKAEMEAGDGTRKSRYTLVEEARSLVKDAIYNDDDIISLAPRLNEYAEMLKTGCYLFDCYGHAMEDGEIWEEMLDNIGANGNYEADHPEEALDTLLAQMDVA